MVRSRGDLSGSLLYRGSGKSAASAAASSASQVRSASPAFSPKQASVRISGGRLALGGDGLARQRQSLKGRLAGIGHQQRQACPLGVGQLGMKRAVGREFVARRLQALLEHRAIRQARYVEAAIEQADEVGAGIGVFCSQRASILRDLGGIELHVCYPVNTRDGKSC